MAALLPRCSTRAPEQPESANRSSGHSPKTCTTFAPVQGGHETPPIPGDRRKFRAACGMGPLTIQVAVLRNGRIYEESRLADRIGFEVLRINVEEGKPSMILTIAPDLETARQRLKRHYEAKLVDEGMMND